jgi:hypothetical protein
MKELIYYQAPTNEIKVPEERVRKEFNKEKLAKLAESFTRFGQKQPGVCTRNDDGTIVLVAGERRLRACQLAQIPYTFTLEDETDPLALLEIELEENLNRENLTWQEQVDGQEKLRTLRTEQRAKEGDHYTLRDQAKETEQSLGQTQEMLELAEFMKHFAEVRDAPTISEAKKVVKKLKSIATRAKLLQDASQVVESKAIVEGTELSLSTGKAQSSEKLIVGGKEIAVERILDLDRRIILGRMEEKLSQFKDESVSILLFDPPWGVGVDESREGFQDNEGHLEKYEDRRESFLGLLPTWLGFLWSKMAPQSHLYMFFGIIHYGFVYSALEEAGFQVNGMPIYWIKQGQHWTRNPEIWPGRAVEPIAFARKGQKKLQRAASDYILTPPPSLRIKQIHPSAKHPDIYLELLKRSALPGDVVLDPMAGSGMAGVAADALSATLKLDWWLIEEKKVFRDLAAENCLKGYSQIVLGKDTLSEGGRYVVLPRDFRDIDLNDEAGPAAWRRYMAEHPEQEEEMIEWGKEQETERLTQAKGKDLYKRMTIGGGLWQDHWKRYPEMQTEMTAWAKEKSR